MTTKLSVLADGEKKRKNWPMIIAVTVVLLVAAVVLASPGFQHAVADHLSSGSTSAPEHAQYDHRVEHREALIAGGMNLRPAGQGNEFVIITIRVVNDQPKEITSNALFWNYRIGGTSYTASAYTFAGAVDYSTINVGQGGDATFQIVYEVPAGLEDGTPEYRGPNADLLVRDTGLL